MGTEARTVVWLAGGVTTVLGAVVASVTFWGTYGWVPRGEYVEDHSTYATVAMLAEHVADFGDVEESVRSLEREMAGIADQLRAYTVIAQQIRDLLRARCMGAQNLDALIASTKAEYERLAGEPWGRDPSCEELNAP